MTLIYKFRKEEVEGGIVTRPKIPVCLKVDETKLDMVALIDSGCDVTVVPQHIAETLGLSIKGRSRRLFAFREATDTVESEMDITFLGKVERQSVLLSRIPVLITLRKEGEDEENEIVLGLHRIFDEFDITFKRSKNRIGLRRASC